MRRGTLIGLMVIFCNFAAYAIAADLQVQIFSLQFRTAESIDAKLRPLLAEGERLSTTDHQVVLIASEQTIRAVEKLLPELDRPLAQYLVKVRWLDTVTRAPGHLGYDAESQRTTLPDDKALIGTSPRMTLQQLRVSAGEPAFFLTGKDIPYQKEWAVWSGVESSGYAGQIAFQQVRSGFRVEVSTTAAGQLEVSLTPQLMDAIGSDSLTPAPLVLDRLTTRFIATPEKWLDISSAMPDVRAGLDILSGQIDTYNSGKRLQVRIDPLN